MPHIIYTIGHSVQPIGDFIALLKQHEIRQLADIRSMPRSRRHPHFSEHALSESLAAENIAYRHIPGLGGLRKAAHHSPNQAFREGGGLQAYADYMQTPEFTAALQNLIEWSTQAPTSIMCAEAKPSECHRQLTSDALLLVDVSVQHIGKTGELTPHKLHPNAEIQAGKLIYPAKQADLF